jgi:RNA methyltransferase, TrmH family
MLSKAKIKFIKSLQVKKYRKQEQCFLVEGAKSVQELLQSEFEIVSLFGTSRFLDDLKHEPKAEIIEVNEKELAGIAEFQTNNTVLAVAKMKPNKLLNFSTTSWSLVLDDIKDPGNLGTIVRTADWYGIDQIIASSETADFYSPKVISSTMGSFTRVSVFYTDLAEFLPSVKQRVFGAYLNGNDVHEADFGEGGMVLIGSESHGIASSLEKFVTDKITIPRYGNAESLNAAIATAIICDNIRRR